MEAFESVLKDNHFKGIPKFDKFDNIIKETNQDMNNENKNIYKNKKEKIIDVSSLPNEEVKETNLKVLIEELDKSELFKNKLDENLKEKDINKIQANIFKKDKTNKDKKKEDFDAKKHYKSNRDAKF